MTVAVEAREYALGMLHDLEDGVDGLEGFMGSVAAIDLLSSDEEDQLLAVVERAHGFCDGFRLCLEQWPKASTVKEDV